MGERIVEIMNRITHQHHRDVVSVLDPEYLLPEVLEDKMYLLSQCLVQLSPADH